MGLFLCIAAILRSIAAIPCKRWHCLLGNNLFLRRHNILRAARNYQATFGGMATQCVPKLGALAHQRIALDLDRSSIDVAHQDSVVITPNDAAGRKKTTS